MSASLKKRDQKHHSKQEGKHSQSSGALQAYKNQLDTLKDKAQNLNLETETKQAKSQQDPESYREIETGEIEDQENYSSSVKEIPKPPPPQDPDSYREIETGEIEDQGNYSSSVKEIPKPTEKKESFDPNADFLAFDTIKPKVSVPKSLEEQMNDK